MWVSFKGWLPASFYPISVFLINVHLSIHKTDRIRFPEFPNPCFQGVWRQPVVGVQKADEFPPGVRQSFISRAAYTCVLLVEYSDPFILPRPFFNNLRRFVSAAVVDDQQFPVGISLPDNRSERTFNKVEGVVNRHDNAHLAFHRSN